MSKPLFFYISLCIVFAACQTKQEYSSQIASEVIVAGKISGFNPEIHPDTVFVYVDDLSTANQLDYFSKVDSTGKFAIKFNRNYPQDIWVGYQVNSRVIVHPGDSLFLEINPEITDYAVFYENIRYSGDGYKLNQTLAEYLALNFKNYTNLEAQHPALDTYKSLMDSIRKVNEIQARDFIRNKNVDKDLASWIHNSITVKHYTNLMDYPGKYRMQNKVPSDWIPTEKYFSFVSSIPVIDKSYLFNSDTRYLINSYLYGYLLYKTYQEYDDSSDSLLLKSIDKHTTNQGVIKQLVLTTFYHNKFKNSDVALYEENRDELYATISEDFLRTPLEEHYNEVKSYLELPVDLNKVNISAITNDPGSYIWENILEENKGKVIYIDCWATWCGPCLVEFPFSRKLKDEYQGKDVAFVYLCFESEAGRWEKDVFKHKLTGDHYFLDKNQGAYFKKMFDIGGYPTYAIVDKNSNMSKVGASLRPSDPEVKSILNELLELQN